jgi:hypothetical protein
MALLDDLKSRLTPAAGGELLLDRTVLGDRLADDFETLFFVDALARSSVTALPDSDPGFHTVAGIGTLLGIGNLPIAITFFTSQEPASAALTLECLLVAHGVPDAWRLNYAYPDLPGYFDYTPDRAGQPAQPSFVADLALTEVAPVYSSFDFTGRSFIDGPPSVPSLQATPMFGDQPLRAGLNFTCQLTCEGDLWNDVRKVLAPVGALDQLHLIGRIWNDLYGPSLDLRHSLADPATGAFPTLSFGGAGALNLGLREVGVTTGLTPGSERPSLLISGFATADRTERDVDLLLPVNAPTALIRANFGTTPLTLPQIEDLLGLKTLTSLLPSSVQSLGGLGLSQLQASLSVADARLEQLVFTITTAQPWTIVPNILSITPTIAVQATTGSGTDTIFDIGVTGDWHVGSTRFETFVSITDGSFAAYMAAGESLDVGAFFDRFLPKSERPDLLIVDLDVYGNFNDDTFGFDLETHGTWDFSLGGKTISIGDIAITGDYDGAAFSGTLAGTLGISGAIVKIRADMAAQITLSVSLDAVNVGAFADELLTLVKLPAELPDFELSNIALNTTPSAGEFTLSGATNTPVQLFSGFDVEVTHFAVSRATVQGQTPAKRVEADLQLAFKIGQVALNVAGSHVAVEGGPAPSSAWAFLASTTGQGIPIGDLLTSLEHLVGLSYPLPSVGLVISDVDLSFNLGGATRQFTLTCQLVCNGQAYGALDLVAQRPADKSAPAASASPAPAPAAGGQPTAAAPVWDYILAITAQMNVGLSDIPVIGPTLNRISNLKLNALQLTQASRAFTDAEVATLCAQIVAQAVPPMGALNAGQRWQVSLSSAQAGGLEAGAFLKDLAGDLGIAVPQALTNAIDSLRLSTLIADIDTHTKAFSILAATTGTSQTAIGLDSHSLALRLSLISSVDAATGKRMIDGHFEADFAMGNATFVVAFDFGPAKIVTGSWTSLKGEHLGLSDIAAALGIAAGIDVPDGLDLDLTSAAFEYRSDTEAFTLSATSAQFGDAFFNLAKDATGAWGFIFSVDSPTGGKLSDLPVIGGDLRAADFLSIEQAAFVVASGNFGDYTIPALPPLPPTPAQAAALPTSTPAAGRAIAPIAAGAPLQLSKGLSLATVIDLTTSNDKRIGNLKSIVRESRLLAQATFGPSALSLFITLPGTVAIPAGGTSSLALGNPMVRITAAPIVIFQLSGSLAFSVNNTPVKATVSLILDETEAEVTVTLAADQAPLPGPPGLKGLHFEEFGIEMGVFFEPPGVDLGLQGKVRIGDVQSAMDDEFAIVLEMIEELPNLLYLAFEVDKLDLGQAITLFTNVTTSSLIEQLQIVKLSDLTFHWCESEVVLPDSTLAQPGFGFSASIQILTFSAHGDLEISVAQGVNGSAEMSPISLRNILHIAGAGKGIVRTYQESSGVWTEVTNTGIVHQVPALPTRRDVIIPPGGPVIAFNAKQSPYLLVGLDVTLFDLVHTGVNATIDNNGFSFTLTFKLANMAAFDLHCVLNGPEHFNANASLSIHLDASVGPIHFMGCNVGSIHLVAGLDAAMAIALDPSRFELDLSGSFNFEGLNLSMPALNLGIAPSSLKELPGQAVQQIRTHADQLFEALFANVGKWADMIGRGVVTGVADMAGTLKTAYHVTDHEAAQLMHTAKQSAQVVAAGLKSAYNSSQDVTTAALKGAGYAANETAAGLKTSYNLSAEDAAKAMKGAGYTVNDVGNGLKSAYGATASTAAVALHGAGFAVNETGNFVKGAYGVSADQLNDALKGAGYATDQVKGFFEGLGGGFKDFFDGTGGKVIKGIEQGGNDIRHFFHL